MTGIGQSCTQPEQNHKMNFLEPTACRIGDLQRKKLQENFDCSKYNQVWISNVKSLGYKSDRLNGSKKTKIKYH